MFGRRRRDEEAAAEAARETERRALFAKLAERPEHICPFLGLADDRAGYVEGVSDDHRCYAFGDPAPLSAEQQTRVCQERGYGNCPRYLRGVLVIPTEELEALRRPRAPSPEPAPQVAVPPPPRRRRGAPIFILLGLLLLLVGGAGAFVLLNRDDGTAVAPTPSATPTVAVTASPSPSVSATTSETPMATPSPAGTGPATPTPEPTPTAGDTFAFYEVSVGPNGYVLFNLDENGVVVGEREASFGGFSYARAVPRRGADDKVYWETREGGLTGWSYLYPDSGDFRVRAVFRSNGDRRSAYLEEEELTVFPEATPAP